MGVIFTFKTYPGQTYIQLQAQKGLIREGPRRQMNKLLVLLYLQTYLWDIPKGFPKKRVMEVGLMG